MCSSDLVAFALIAGEDLSMIQSSADAAQIRYDNSFPTGITPIDLAGVTSLKRIFPNPSSTAATIEFSVKENTRTSIAVYNTTGQLVKSVFEEQLNAGKYSLNIDVSTIPSGSYMVRFEAGGVIQTRPLQIVK